MKKLWLILALLLVCSQAKADLLDKLPTTKQGIAYSVKDGALNYLMTFDAVAKGNFALGLGYAGAAEGTRHKAVMTLSYKLVPSGTLDFPILKYVEIEPCLWAGMGNLNIKDLQESEDDWGVGASLFKIKF
jgi:hypothetical protein